MRRRACCAAEHHLLRDGIPAGSMKSFGASDLERWPTGVAATCRWAFNPASLSLAVAKMILKPGILIIGRPLRRSMVAADGWG